VLTEKLADLIGKALVVRLARLIAALLWTQSIGTPAPLGCLSNSYHQRQRVLAVSGRESSFHGDWPLTRASATISIAERPRAYTL
jgi:hypothetical protein